MSEEQINQQPPQDTEEVNSSAEEVVNEEVKEETTEQPPVEKKEEDETPLENIDANDEGQVAEMLNHKGFDLNKLQEEFDQNGDITEETRAELAKVGITKEILDSYIEGRWAVVEKQMDDIAASVGGREAFESICNWARANLSEEERAVYSSFHDPASIKIAIRDLKNRMESKEGYIPQQIQGSGDTASNDYFQSMAEIEEAINDPKYAKDEVYRQKVARKITASREAGMVELK
jgi:hypothetical protein